MYIIPIKFPVQVNCVICLEARRRKGGGGGGEEGGLSGWHGMQENKRVGTRRKKERNIKLNSAKNR